MGKLAVVVDEALKTVRRPKRLLKLASRRKVHKLRQRLARDRAGGWNETGGPFRQRQYRSYEDYLAHQASKLGQLDLSDYERIFRPALRGRLATLPVSWSGKNVLCLAARIGTEVRAFHELGSFAVGIDLNPGKNNGLVLPGDFQNIQFPDDSVDVIYTNSLDHAFDLGGVIAESKRVLKPGGIAVIEAVEANRHGAWEALYWSSDDAVVEEFVSRGFELCGRTTFEAPWHGVQFLLRAPS